MRPIQQKVQGKLFESDEQTTLWLWREGDAVPSDVPIETVYLRYGLIVRGVEVPFFPAELLNDWGETLRGTKLYRWLRDNGELNPRAELFGFDPYGNETQYFARDLEIFWKTPCYAVCEPDASFVNQLQVNHIIIADPAVDSLEKIKRPTDIKMPLNRASVKWWRLPPSAVATFQVDDHFA